MGAAPRLKNPSVRDEPAHLIDPGPRADPVCQSHIVKTESLACLVAQRAALKRTGPRHGRQRGEAVWAAGLTIQSDFSCKMPSFPERFTAYIKAST